MGIFFFKLLLTELDKKWPQQATERQGMKTQQNKQIILHCMAFNMYVDLKKKTLLKMWYGTDTLKTTG